MKCGIIKVLVEKTLYFIPLMTSKKGEKKGHMGAPVKNILITLLINTSSNLKEKVIRVK